jgi:hypothetical protein
MMVASHVMDEEMNARAGANFALLQLVARLRLAQRLFHMGQKRRALSICRGGARRGLQTGLQEGHDEADQLQDRTSRNMRRAATVQAR